MKRNLLLLTLLLFAIRAISQEKPGYFHFGFHAALPQNGLKKANYDDGGGFHMGWITRGLSFNKNSPYSLHSGFVMDFDWLDRREFDVQLNTPVPDMGRVEIYNSSFGFFGVLRNQFDYGRAGFYGDLLFGGRSYTTTQQITAKNPLLNPDYESTTTFPDVVVTSKTQFGFGGGMLYKLGRSVYADLGFTYCMGPEGLVQPLRDIQQEGNEIRYAPRKAVTDILLIRGSLVFKLHRVQPTSSPGPYTPSSPYEREIQRNNSYQNNPPARLPEVPKKSLEVKPNTPAPKKKVDY